MTNDKKYDSTYSILLDILNEVEQGGSGAGIPDAPVDGKTYGRNNANWVEVTSGGVGEQDSYTVYIPLISNTTGEITRPLLEKFLALNIQTFAKLIEANNNNKAYNVTLRSGANDMSGIPQVAFANATKILVARSSISITFIDASMERRLLFDINTGDVTKVITSAIATKQYVDDNHQYIIQYVDDLVGTANNKLNLI